MSASGRGRHGVAGGRRPRGKAGLRLRLGALAGRTSGRIAILAAAVVVLWLGGAAFGVLIGAYATFNEAIWDAIWHMIDPGALGDDETTKQRIVGAFLALAGLIILAGAVLTIFEELVERALGRLGSSDPAVSVTGHLLVIGSNTILPAIVSRVAAERPAGPSAIVVLVPAGDAIARQSLRRELEGLAGDVEVLVVGGDIKSDGLDRVCVEEAARIVVLAPELTDPDVSDLRVMGTSAQLAAALPDPARPPISLQMSRGRNVDLIWDRLPPDFDALVEDRATAAALGLSLMHPAFAEVLSGIEGEDSLRLLGGLEGVPFGAIIERRPALIPIGVVRGRGAAIEARFAPDPERPIEPGERVIAFGEPGGDAVAGDVSGERAVAGAAAGPGPAKPAISDARQAQRLLIIGWSDAARALVNELNGLVEIEALTVFDETRPSGLSERIGEIATRFIAGDPGDPDRLDSGLAEARPSSVLVAAGPGTDARAALIAMRLEQKADRPHFVVQQSGAEHAGRLRVGLTHGHVVSTAELVGGTVALSATEPEALAIREAMAGGRVGRIGRVVVAAESAGAGHAGGEGSEVTEPTFAAVHRHCLALGMAPLGLARAGERIDYSLRPDTPISPGDELLVVRGTVPRPS